MNLKVRNRFAVAAVGALACSLASAPLASAAPVAEDNTSDDQGLTIVTGEFEGRIAGKSRFGTAVAASKAAQDIGNTVILANSTAWSDTLAATPLADILNAPVLYTHRDKLEDVTIAELQRLQDEGVTDVVLVGGELVIQPAVAAQLGAMGFTVDRIGGTSRYDTALLLAAEAVDYYEDGDGDLASDRAEIAQLKALEAAFQAALANWEAARGVTDARFNDVLSAQEVLNELNADLARATEAIQTVPSVVIPGVGTVDSLDAYNNLLALWQNRASNATTLQAFVADRLVEYVAVNSADFQDDSWNDDVVPFFGATEFSITLKTGAGEPVTYTGTLTELQAQILLLDWSVDLFGDDDTVKMVQEDLENEVDFSNGQAASVRDSYAQIVQRIQERLKAQENNAALAAQITAIQDDIDDAEVALDDAVEAFDEANAAEAVAKAAFLEAAEDRPDGERMSHSQLEYETTLAGVIDDGTKYPAFLATGLDFPDALAAGPAAAAETGVILLTRGTAVPDATQRYLDEDPNTVAVGGPAAAAVEADVEYVGYSRYETATAIAAAYFNDPSYVGLASGAVAADAVIGGALMANVDGTLVLTRHNTLPDTTRDFLSYEVDEPHLVVFGGPLAISEAAEQAAVEALGN